MITRLEEIPVTKESYPFASAERYLKLSERGYVETEYYMYGTANVYETADERGNVRVRTADAPYTNRIIVRAPQDTAHWNITGNWQRRTQKSRYREDLYAGRMQKSWLKLLWNLRKNEDWNRKNRFAERARKKSRARSAQIRRR